MEIIRNRGSSSYTVSGPLLEITLMVTGAKLLHRNEARFGGNGDEPAAIADAARVAE